VTFAKGPSHWRRRQPHDVNVDRAAKIQEILSKLTVVPAIVAPVVVNRVVCNNEHPTVVAFVRPIQSTVSIPVSNVDRSANFEVFYIARAVHSAAEPMLWAFQADVRAQNVLSDENSFHIEILFVRFVLRLRF